jgi:hypothetical protein
MGKTEEDYLAELEVLRAKVAELQEDSDLLHALYAVVQARLGERYRKALGSVSRENES